MDPAQFLDVAKKLLNVRSEAAYRSAVSRGYYSLFHVASTFLAKLGFNVEKGPQAHGQLPARFNNCGVKEAREIARWLRDLHRQRLLADYDLNSEEFSVQFKSAIWIAQAEQAIFKLNTIAASQNLCNQIRNGICAYEEKLKA